MLATSFLLNSNIRCIEMITRPNKYLEDIKLNSNIRCIEMTAELFKIMLESVE